MSSQKNGPARAQTGSSGLYCPALRLECAAGLPVGQAVAQCSVLQEREGSQAGFAFEDAGDSSNTRSIRFRRVHVLLKREGWKLGKNQMYRIYCEERLQLRSKLPKRRKMVVTRLAKAKPTAPNEAWSMDFVADQLSNGARFRALTIVDVFTKESLAIEVGQRLRGEHVVEVLNRLAAQRRTPKYLFVDNGSEFSGRLLDLWAYHHGTRIDFSRPGKPTDNCHVETFNGSFRDECLNLHWFETLEDAKASIETWRREYNESRPHSTLKELTPAEYACQVGISGPDLCL